MSFSRRNIRRDAENPGVVRSAPVCDTTSSIGTIFQQLQTLVCAPSFLLSASILIVVSPANHVAFINQTPEALSELEAELVDILPSDEELASVSGDDAAEDP